MLRFILFFGFFVNFSLQNLEEPLALEVPSYVEKGMNVSIKCVWKECELVQGCGKQHWNLNYETPLHGIIFFCVVTCTVPWNKRKFT